MGYFAILVGMEKHIKLKKVKRARKHGFLARMASHTGQLVIKRRRAKKRSSLTI
jgi:ribosomal protein L34